MTDVMKGKLMGNSNRLAKILEPRTREVEAAQALMRVKKEVGAALLEYQVARKAQVDARISNILNRLASHLQAMEGLSPNVAHMRPGLIGYLRTGVASEFGSWLKVELESWYLAPEGYDLRGHLGVIPIAVPTGSDEIHRISLSENRLQMKLATDEDLLEEAVRAAEGGAG